MYSANDGTPGVFLDRYGPASGGAASLTYEPFYGLREKPFSLSADPRFLFRSPTHAPAFDSLLSGIRRREGLIVLTGEIGTGKTTLCRSVLQQLDRRTFSSFVADPFVSREDLLKTLLVDFGVISIGDLTGGRFSGASRSDLSYPLYEFLDSLVPLQAFAVVIIDEAQNLSLPLLEEIRILSELERREKLLQVVLVGQPELRSSLKLPQMRQVDQRVSVRCELTALDAEGVVGYVLHRLAIAGPGQNRVEFTRAALEAIHEGSSGVPRLINRICDRALQRAYPSRTTRIDVDFVWNAIADLGLSAADDAQDQWSRQTRSHGSRPPSVAEPPAVIPAAEIGTQSEAESGLADFRAEDGSSRSDWTIQRPDSRTLWMAAAAAAFLVVSASIGVPAWQTAARAGDGRDLAAMVPPPPPHNLAQPAVVPPRVDPSSLPSLMPGDAMAASAGVLAARSGASKPRDGYSILVASFLNRDRAERLAEELTNAGYGARTVDADAGARGRFVQVKISGYTSAIDVQRDLQRIRELPGGYGDARVVDRE
jgi:general secretion pathway protein A